MKLRLMIAKSIANYYSRIINGLTGKKDLKQL